MGCCGRGAPSSGGPIPLASFQASPARAAQHVQPTRQTYVFFEYVGRTGMTVIGGVTGRHYRFDRPSARLAVDPVDKPSLLAVPNLRVTYGP